MLRTRADPADEQREDQQRKARARAGQAEACAGERRAERKHRGGAETLRDQPGGDLQPRHGAGKQAAQQPELRISEPELLLPNRQHDVDQVGVAVMQRMRAAGDAGGAAFVAPCGQRGRFVHGLARDAHGICGSRSLRSTKALLMNEITGSPCWFTPLLRTKMMPQPGRLAKGRISMTSVVYETVSPT